MSTALLWYAQPVDSPFKDRWLILLGSTVLVVLGLGRFVRVSWTHRACGVRMMGPLFFWPERTIDLATVCFATHAFSSKTGRFVKHLLLYLFRLFIYFNKLFIIYLAAIYHY